ncbi:SDR family oxidoreductase [Solibacillus sp. FSL W7-1472]|uniref:SDR family NAD(P)-dependent oxidoreductase n=1 Tax=Solibacillus sp. FSL W7-1472 TaxID=2921707 RepID=UPI0030DD5D18
MLIEQKVAIVTGAANGMGKATAQLFIEHGATVVLVDYQEQQGIKTAQMLGSNAYYFNPVDITKPVQIQQVVQKTIAKFGRIDILVNCAGGVMSPNGSSSNIDMSEWQAMIELNLTGTMNVIMEVLPHMKEQKAGKIINLSSLGALNPYVPVLHYHAAKAGVESITKNLAFELASMNIHVNTIAPGPILTPFWDKLMPPGEEREAMITELAKKEVPLGRIGQPEDIAGVALFLASSLSDFVTGQKINVGGGIGNIISMNGTFTNSPGNKEFAT